MSTGDSISLGELRPVGEVSPAARPVGVPGVGVFVGRGGELAALDVALHGEGAVVVQAVSGLGGIGKSALVARYVLEHAAQYGQVVWVTAAGRAELEDGLARFVVALEPQVAGVLSSEGLVARALGWLASHEGWLLVLDNVSDPGLVRDLLPRLGSGRVVVTSRRATGWAGIAQPLRLDVLEAGAARDLVALTVGAEGAGLLAGVEGLCERLGFLPLALEQAAAFMAQNRVSAARYVELWDAAPAGMFADAAEGTAVERTVARVWSVSLDALADEPLCGEVLRVLAWLSPDGVPRELLFGLADERRVVRALGRLAAYSMVAMDETGVVTVHRVVQEVARTAQDGDVYRGPMLVQKARLAAGRILSAAVPGTSEDPGFWPLFRQLAVQTAAYAGYVAEDGDTHEMCFLLNEIGRFLTDQGSLPLALGYLRRALAGRERLMGTEHSDTLVSRNDLAAANLAAGNFARAIELFERNVADRERVLGAENPHTLLSRNNLATANLAAGDFVRAIDLLERNLVDRERLLGTEHANTLASRMNLASAYHTAGDFARAIELLEQSAIDSERVLGAEHPDTLTSRINLAVAYLEAGGYARAIELLERSVADSERVLGAEHPQTLISRNNLVEAYRAAGDFAGAIELLERSVADSERVLGAEHPDALTFRNNLAAAYLAAGGYARAIELFERNVADRERVLGAEHPRTLTSRNDLAAAHLAAGDIARAIELLERNVADAERVLSPEHPDTLTSRINLASAYHKAGDFARAIELLERSVADRERVLGAEHPQTLISRNNLAEAYRAAGDFAGAIELLERNVPDSERVLGADHPDTLTSRNNLAEAYLQVGGYARAIELFERSVADSERVLGAEHPRTVVSRINFATAYLAAGDFARAIELLERSVADSERVLGAEHPHTLTSRHNLHQARSAAGQVDGQPRL